MKVKPRVVRTIIDFHYDNLLISHFCIYNDHMIVCMIDIEIHSEGPTWKREQILNLKKDNFLIMLFLAEVYIFILGQRFYSILNMIELKS